MIILDDLKSAFDATDVRFGLYFSLYEWFNPWYKRDKRNEFTTNEFVRVSKRNQRERQADVEKDWGDRENNNTAISYFRTDLISLIRHRFTSRVFWCNGQKLIFVCIYFRAHNFS